MVMDGTILRHRLGDPTLVDDEQAHDALEVLRPSSTNERRRRRSSSDNYDEEADKNTCDDGISKYLDEDRTTGVTIDAEGTPCSVLPQQQQLRLASSVMDESGVISRGSPLATAGDRDVPTRPRESRRRNLWQEPNRRLQSAGPSAGRTVVVLASVPTVVAATRPKLTRGPPSALFGSKSSHSALSATVQPQQQGFTPEKASSVVPQSTTAHALPWPLGRRCW